MLQLSPLDLPPVIGHRGAAAYAPENTLASFCEARQRGATWVETDVKLTSDGVPILMHDASLKRTTGIDRLVAKTPRAALPPSVPTLEAAIACFVEAGLGCNFEIKPCEGREVETAHVTVATLRRFWPLVLPAPLLSSFKETSLAAAREAGPEFARALLLEEIADDWRQRARAVDAAAVNTDGRKLKSDRAREIKRSGFLLGVYTINEAEQARTLKAMGADCIITDAPDVILAALG